MKPVADSNSLGFTDEDLLDIVDLEDDSDMDWSMVVAPPSKQFSDWVFEDDERDDGRAEVTVGIRERKGGVERGFAQTGEVLDIAKGFFTPLSRW